ncbi:hypothetical protein [Tuwongella immobilis]|uniref:Uncharacterized protein n=1 Tax=Tuwongella immobilis TaxID=692036 RepID=A0A6C2YV07_9BACT|nr:hypothetical protein [Tuwongella immobilis]VIP05197.1 unnamed protein product [Tuwongella immobilis]VTS07750.1 unnamed protein product [Tuwongella immobilis]
MKEAQAAVNKMNIQAPPLKGKADLAEFAGKGNHLPPKAAEEVGKVTAKDKPTDLDFYKCATEVETALKVKGRDVEIIGFRQAPPRTAQRQPGAMEPFATGWHVVVHDKKTDRFIDPLAGARACLLMSTVNRGETTSVVNGANSADSNSGMRWDIQVFSDLL